MTTKDYSELKLGQTVRLPSGKLYTVVCVVPERTAEHCAAYCARHTPEELRMWTPQPHDAYPEFRQLRNGKLYGPQRGLKPENCTLVEG